MTSAIGLPHHNFNFKRGDKVIALYNHAYSITVGKEYEIQSYEPPYRDPTSPSGFIWPAYVIVTGDDGEPLHCHASRFELKTTQGE